MDSSTDKSPQVFAPDVTTEEAEDQQPPPLPPKKKQKKGQREGRQHRRGHNSIELAYQDVIIETREQRRQERRMSLTDGISADNDDDGDDDEKTNTTVDQHRPDSPRFFFQESYKVTITKPQSLLNMLEGDSSKGLSYHCTSSSPPPFPQIVHHHVNGLVVVTIGNELRNNTGIYNLPQQQQQKLTSSVGYGLDGIDRVEIEGVEFTCQPGPSCNAGQTRKKHAKMLKKGPRQPTTKGNINSNRTSSSITSSDSVVDDHNDGIVTPTTMIAKVTVSVTSRRRAQQITQNATLTGDNKKGLKNEYINEQDEEIQGDRHDGDKAEVVTITTTTTTTIPFYACVWGTIVELNPEILVRPNLLVDDPLMDGHLAIIHPAGTFPPPPVTPPQTGVAT